MKVPLTLDSSSFLFEEAVRNGGDLATEIVKSLTGRIQSLENTQTNAKTTTASFVPSSPQPSLSLTAANSENLLDLIQIFKNGAAAGDRKIYYIKELRDNCLPGLGLKAAKELIEALMKNRSNDSFEIAPGGYVQPKSMK